MKRGASLAFALTLGMTSMLPAFAFADDTQPPPPPAAPAPTAPPPPAAPATGAAPTDTAAAPAPSPPPAAAPAPSPAPPPDSSASGTASTADFSVSAETTPKNYSTEKVIGFSVLGLGVVSLIVGAVEGARWHSAQNDADAAQSQVASNTWDVCRINDPNAVIACQKQSDAGDARQAMYVFLGVGTALTLTGAGILVNAYLEHKDTGTAQKAGKLRVVPTAGPKGGGLDLKMTF